MPITYTIVSIICEQNIITECSAMFLNIFNECWSIYREVIRTSKAYSLKTDKTNNLHDRSSSSSLDEKGLY